ncbi:MAG: D-aminoacyl-tRNA deacylase [Vicinamibacterales bacterium]|nr:D-tyrosyl-tRNA(Tyr) deacylase [Acidobacteriota bacterium]MDP7294426.1 D-aminoacyl-tRNA deacylase [Vicinamibacterales bacterium]MDP7473224.1 D-aminoacyl-tRNA deacylase [Vicinamibacterales bacterium]MDP7671571.1 D-aminoacyl-tRNA deacylase [Vicinamibacterales bacterium]HJO38380.1 D-aminoacyl-tRNA deacylase [Vicinamibacterales bacterium]
MRAVVQRVTSARVTVADRVVGEIGRGLLVLLGIAGSDGRTDVEYLARKLLGLRVFDDPAGKMNFSVQERGGAVLVVSQFTLCGDTRRGRRPSYDAAAPPEVARPLYEALIDELRRSGVQVATGEFQAMMDVASVNDGPVTLLLDSEKRF